MQREMAIRFDFDNDAQFATQCEELAESLIKVNMLELAHNTSLPCCLACGDVQYIPPQPCYEPARHKGGIQTCRAPRRPRDKCQAIFDARTIYKRKKGTCFDLACERAARLRLKGTPARVVVEQQRYAGRPMLGQYHAYVQTPHGVEDPSHELQTNPGRCAGSCGCNRRHR